VTNKWKAKVKELSHIKMNECVTKYFFESKENISLKYVFAFELLILLRFIILHTIQAQEGTSVVHRKMFVFLVSIRIYST
jgi:uncharacterized protein (UPF0333 family)